MKEKNSRTAWMLACTVALSLGAGCASQELSKDVALTEEEYSGFLKDYSKLEKVIDRHGNETMSRLLK